METVVLDVFPVGGPLELAWVQPITSTSKAVPNNTCEIVLVFMQTSAIIYL